MDTTCPVTLVDIFRAEFKAMTDADLEGFAGIEYDGFTAEIKDCIVVLDHGPVSVVQVHQCTDDGDVSCWSMELPSFTQII